MISRDTLARCRISGPIRVTTANKFNHSILNRHVCFETKTGAVRAIEISYQLVHCALSLGCGIEDLRGWLLDGELHVWSPRCHEDEFSNGKVGAMMTIQRNCCREIHHSRASTWISSRFRVVQPVKVQRGFHELSMVSHLEAPAFLGVFKTQKKLTVLPSLRNIITSVKYRLVFMCSNCFKSCSSGPVPTTSSM